MYSQFQANRVTSKLSWEYPNRAKGPIIPLNSLVYHTSIAFHYLLLTNECMQTSSNFSVVKQNPPKPSCIKLQNGYLHEGRKIRKAFCKRQLLKGPSYTSMKKSLDALNKWIEVVSFSSFIGGILNESTKAWVFCTWRTTEKSRKLQPHMHQWL